MTQELSKDVKFSVLFT